MESDVVFWTDLDERKEISRQIENRGKLLSCTGFVDGTLFPLEYKPELDGADYFSRKGSYAISGLVVCDYHKHIRHVYTGWPGCGNDNRIYENSRLYISPNYLCWT